MREADRERGKFIGSKGKTEARVRKGKMNDGDIPNAEILRKVSYHQVCHRTKKW